MAYYPPLRPPSAHFTWDEVIAHSGYSRVPLGPQSECPEAAEDEEAVEWSGDCPRRVLQEPKALGSLLVVRRDHPVHGVGVAGEVLRGRVEDDVGAQLERVLEGRRRERVVDDEDRPGMPALSGSLADRRDADTQKPRVD